MLGSSFWGRLRVWNIEAMGRRVGFTAEDAEGFWVLGAGFWGVREGFTAEGAEGAEGFWVLGAGFWGVGEGFTAEGAEGAEGFWVLGAGFWGRGISPSPSPQPPYRVRGRLSPTTGEGEEVCSSGEGERLARATSSGSTGWMSSWGVVSWESYWLSGKEPPLCISPPAGERLEWGVSSPAGERLGRVFSGYRPRIEYGAGSSPV